jgi:DNA-directed RNA polymerase subunit RPC12/RpoP
MAQYKCSKCGEEVFHSWELLRGAHEGGQVIG